MANRVFNWAVNRRRVDVSPLAGLKRPARQESRDRVLDDNEIKALWNANVDAVAAAFIKILLITGQRRATVAGMRWDEIDAGDKQWHIPGERMKNGDAHTVPLPQIGLDILEKLPRYKEGPFVFSTTEGKKPISEYSKMKERIDKAVEIAPWSLHDLRRTMATQMAKIGIQQHVVEKLLDHRSGKISGIAAVYNRHEYREEQKATAEAWASRLSEILEHKNGEASPCTRRISAIAASPRWQRTLKCK